MTIPQTPTTTVAARVRELLDEKGISENRAAEATGIPRTTLRRHLLGNPPGFTIAQITLLASLLEVDDVSDLLRQSETAADAEAVA